MFFPNHVRILGQATDNSENRRVRGKPKNEGSFFSGPTTKTLPPNPLSGQFFFYIKYVTTTWTYSMLLTHLLH